MTKRQIKKRYKGNNQAAFLTKLIFVFSTTAIRNWRGKNKTELLPICEKFKAQKADLIQICQDFKDINAATKEDIIGFLETFFEEVEHETFL